MTKLSAYAEAFQIALKYGDVDRPIVCSDDFLSIVFADDAKLTDDDWRRMTELGFTRDAGDSVCFSCSVW